MEVMETWKKRCTSIHSSLLGTFTGKIDPYNEEASIAFVVHGDCQL